MLHVGGEFVNHALNGIFLSVGMISGENQTGSSLHGGFTLLGLLGFDFLFCGLGVEGDNKDTKDNNTFLHVFLIIMNIRVLNIFYHILVMLF